MLWKTLIYLFLCFVLCNNLTYTCFNETLKGMFRGIHMLKRSIVDLHIRWDR
ncbi:unnamed protein product [Musa acuminata subsp. burmannicoides]